MTAPNDPSWPSLTDLDLARRRLRSWHGGHPDIDVHEAVGHLLDILQAYTSRVLSGPGTRPEDAYAGAAADPLELAAQTVRPRRKGHAMTAHSGWQYAEFVTGPGAGKSMARAVSLVLSARGPVVAASRTAGLWADTAASRAQAGKTWLFDPCGITREEQQFWTDPLGVVTSVETAHQLASHFALTVEGRAQRACWWPAAQTLLTALFLAASTSGRTLTDVAQWLDQPSMPDPASALDSAGYTGLASGLRGAQYAVPQTRDGIYQAARAATQVIRDGRVMRWVTLQPGLPSLDAASLLESDGTLYLVSQRRSRVAPLVAAVINGVIRAGIQRGQQVGGQDDPPGLIVTDDAASIWASNTRPTLRSLR